MKVGYYINNKRIDWKKIKLIYFTKHIVPKGWEQMFIECNEHVFPLISDYLYSETNIIYPEMCNVFNAFIPPDDIKVVFIGQDPYINKDEATGLAFSVPNGIKIPPSLKNIYRELEKEGYTEYENRNTGNLNVWVEKGIFLLNIALSVEAHKSGLHIEIWEPFMRLILSKIGEKENIAWILLGKEAEKCMQYINSVKNGIFIAGHPSPLNRKNNFIGSGVFKNAELYLKKLGRDFSWHLTT